VTRFPKTRGTVFDVYFQHEGSSEHSRQEKSMTNFSGRLAKNITKLPPYLFARIDKLKADALSKGVDVIDVTVGDPDKPTFPAIIRGMKKALGDLEKVRVLVFEPHEPTVTSR
jgi:hypothetical protein